MIILNGFKNIYEPNYHSQFLPLYSEKLIPFVGLDAEQGLSRGDGSFGPPEHEHKSAQQYAGSATTKGKSLSNSLSILHSMFHQLTALPLINPMRILVDTSRVSV